MHILKTYGDKALPSEEDGEGKNALHYCAEIGDQELFDRLVFAHGLDITKIDKLGNTLLMLAVKNNHLELVNYILETFDYLDLSVQNHKGQDALAIAIEEKHTDIQALLRKKLNDRLRLQHALEETVSESEAIIEEFERLKAENMQMREALTESLACSENLASEYKGARDIADAKTAQLLLSTETVQTLTTKKDALENKTEWLSQENIDLQQKLSEKEQEGEKLKQLSTLRLTKIKELRSENTQLKGRHNLLSDENEKLIKLNSELQEMVSQLKQEIEKKQKQFTRDIKKQLSESDVRHKYEIDQLKRERQQDKREQEKREKEDRQFKKNMLCEIEKLKKQSEKQNPQQATSKSSSKTSHLPFFGNKNKTENEPTENESTESEMKELKEVKPNPVNATQQEEKSYVRAGFR